MKRPAIGFGISVVAVSMMMAIPCFAGDRSVDLTGGASFIHLTQTDERSLLVKNDVGFTAGLNVFIGDRFSLDFTAGLFEPDASIDLPTSRTPGNRITPAAVRSATVGKVKLIPITAALQYHFAPSGKFDPYIGGGVEYILLGNFRQADEVNFEEIDFNDDYGGLVMGGVGIGLGRNLAIDLNAKYVAFGSSVKASGSTPLELDLKPVILSAGLSYRF